MSDINIDYITKLYTSGVTAQAIADELGITICSVRGRLRKAGVKKTKARAVNFSDDQISEIIAMYSSGIGYEGVAKAFGASGGVIKRLLKKHGVHIRNRSEQQFARMALATPEEIKYLTSAANKAATGRKKTDAERVKAAITREKNLSSVSELEMEFARIFTDAGYDFTQQKAVGFYNCDFTIGRVAVEVWGGQWHFTGDHFARTPERVKHILNAGYDIIIVPINTSNPFSAGLQEELIRQINILGCDPSSVRQYRMIWRNGEIVTSGGADCDFESFKQPFTNGRNPVSGRYETVFK